MIAVIYGKKNVLRNYPAAKSSEKFDKIAGYVAVSRLLLVIFDGRARVWRNETFLVCASNEENSSLGFSLRDLFERGGRRRAIDTTYRRIRLITLVHTSLSLSSLQKMYVNLYVPSSRRRAHVRTHDIRNCTKTECLRTGAA